MTWKTILLLYWIAMTATGFCVTVWDKRAAKKHRWRVRERTLFLLAALGGSIGVYVAMLLARHKTLHARFVWGIPCIIAVQIALGIFVCSLVK